MKCVLLSVMLCSVLVRHNNADIGNQFFEEDLTDYINARRFSSIPCHQPQLRAVSVKQLFPDLANYVSFNPEITMLRVCDKACGTCSSGYVCAPLYFNTFRRYFKVTFFQDFQHYKKGDTVYRQYDLQDHTQCSCQNESHQSGSDK